MTGKPRGIDAIIAQRRRGGERSNVKTFRLARSRAVAKMRKFALADPTFFVLELVQSAIAHGATMVHIEAPEDYRRAGALDLVYGGAHYRSEELGQLFDFLFAAKDDLATAHVRDLAVGINAMLAFTPDEVTVRSGDGTVAGSCTMTVRGQGEAVELGTPAEAVNGTRIYARGLTAPAGFEKSRLGVVVYDRCMLTPVPVVLNGESLSGFSSSRSLPLFGYDPRIGVDEGDLYGTIGLTESAALKGIKLMVRGVWIETATYDRAGKSRVGGAVSFDRLRKTADHAGFVRDERFHELITRLGPYVARLENPALAKRESDYATLDGETIDPARLRGLVAANRRIVCLLTGAPSGATPTEAVRRRAARVGRALSTPVVIGSGDDVDHLASLSGGDCDVVVVTARGAVVGHGLDGDPVVRFFERAPSPLPAQPWLVAPRVLDPVPLPELAASVASELSVGAHAVVREFGRRYGVVRATLYTPEVPRDPSFVLSVSVRMCEREVWRGRVLAAFPGHELVVEMPGLPEETFAKTYEGRRLAERIGRAMAERAAEAVEEAAGAATHVLAPAMARPKTNSAYIALAVLARHGVLRWEAVGETLEFWVQVPRRWRPLLDARLLRTRGGAERSLAQVVAALGERGGILPAVASTAPGADDDALLLDAVEERALAAILGENCIDWRDRPDAGEAALRSKVVAAVDAAEAASIRDEPLFPDRAGGGHSVRGLVDRAARGETVFVYRSSERRVRSPRQHAAVVTAEVLASPFVLCLLARLGLPAPSVESYEAVHDADLVREVAVEEPGAVGVLGIPATPPEHGAVVLEGPHGREALRGITERFGVVGVLRVEDLDVGRDRAEEAARRCIESALEALGNDPLDGAERARIAEAVLGFGGKALKLRSRWDEPLEASVSDPLALRVLRVPLFPTPGGGVQSVMQRIDRLRVLRAADRTAELPPTGDPVLDRFTDRRLGSRNIEVVPPPEWRMERGGTNDPADGVGARIAGIIGELRTDEARRDGPVRVHVVGDDVDAPAARYASGTRTVLLNRHDPLIARHHDAAVSGSAEALVWLSLLSYGALNDLLDAVTNSDEERFQRRLTRAWLDGRLDT